jgi:hypothetical protein
MAFGHVFSLGKKRDDDTNGICLTCRLRMAIFCFKYFGFTTISIKFGDQFLSPRCSLCAFLRFIRDTAIGAGYIEPRHSYREFWVGADIGHRLDWILGNAYNKIETKLSISTNDGTTVVLLRGECNLFENGQTYLSRT